MFATTNASQGLSFFPDYPKHHQFDAYLRTCSNHIRADTLRRFYEAGGLEVDPRLRIRELLPNK